MCVSWRARLRRNAVILSLGSAGLATPSLAQGSGRVRALIVTGVAGEPQLGVMTHKQATTMIDALTTRFAVPASDIVYLAETPEIGMRRASRRRRRSRTSSASWRRSVSGRRPVTCSSSCSSATVVATTRRRGSTCRGRTSRPRTLHACSTALAVDHRRGERPSASGGFVGTLSGPNRVIATATKSGMERNRTRFASHFVQAYAADVADADKDGRVSVLEAYEYARREVVRAYEAENHMLTNTPSSMTAAIGRALRRPTRNRATGCSRGACFLAARRAASRPPRARRAIHGLPRWSAKDMIETRIDSLRRQKATMDSTAYERRWRICWCNWRRRARRFATRREGGRDARLGAAIGAAHRRAGERLVRQRSTGVGLAGRPG